MSYRKRLPLVLGVLLGASVLATVVAPIAQEAAVAPVVSIRDLMERTITPASNTLWGAYEAPTTPAEWRMLEEAAVTMLVAAQVNSIGGTGPADADWVQQPAWKAFNTVMLEASRDALTAIRAQDHDALLAAGDKLYPPCEGCHVQFNPGVIGDNP